jgi:hypothetical protein
MTPDASILSHIDGQLVHFGVRGVLEASIVERCESLRFIRIAMFSDGLILQLKRNTLQFYNIITGLGIFLLILDQESKDLRSVKNP